MFFAQKNSVRRQCLEVMNEEELDVAGTLRHLDYVLLFEARGQEREQVLNYCVRFMTFVFMLNTFNVLDVKVFC